MIVALPGLFSYLFWFKTQKTLRNQIHSIKYTKNDLDSHNISLECEYLIVGMMDSGRCQFSQASEAWNPSPPNPPPPFWATIVEPNLLRHITEARFCAVQRKIPDYCFDNVAEWNLIKTRGPRWPCIAHLILRQVWVNWPLGSREEFQCLIFKIAAILDFQSE